MANLSESSLRLMARHIDWNAHEQARLALAQSRAIDEHNALALVESKGKGKGKDKSKSDEMERQELRELIYHTLATSTCPSIVEDRERPGKFACVVQRKRRP